MQGKLSFYDQNGIVTLASAGRKNGLSLRVFKTRTDFAHRASTVAIMLGEREVDFDAPPRQAFLV
ncbi:hypothetical protein [Robbsia andropogonis]|uniref:hypothetical protein n=1 Tax=Robbsia andropogonis TaxID=28092 RepID=UPI001642E3BB|nr:hypothetical protein [Robbsia andropogonis]